MITAVTLRGGSKDGFCLWSDGDVSTFGECKQSVALYGVNYGQGVPHLLPRIAIVVQIDLADRMMFVPRIVGNHLINRIFDTIAHFARRGNRNILKRKEDA